MSALSIGVVGATGRMGRSIIQCLAESPDLTLAFALARHAGRDAGEVAGVGPLGVPIVSSFKNQPGVDALIDFSSRGLLLETLDAAVRGRTPLVIGTTGYDEEARARMNEACTHIPLLVAANMSVGVQVLLDLVERAAALLGPTFDTEIVEVHHRNKTDAPSGTAQALVSARRHVDRGLSTVGGREGIVGKRAPGELGVHAVRGGDVVGDHTVLFLGDGERVELTHRATDRRIFARGALRAARFLAGQVPGLYTFRDVVQRAAL